MEVIFIFLCSLTPLLWLRPGEIILGHDSGFRLNPLGYLATLWYSWNPTVDFGLNIDPSKGFLIAQLPEAIFARLAGSLSVGQTMSFVFWFFMIGISMYVLIRSFFSEKHYWPFRLTASVFYMYNFFLLQGWFIAERAKFSLFAALPLLIVVIWKTLDRRYKILHGSILFGLTLFVLNGGGSPPLYGGILVSLCVLVLFFLLRAIRNKSARDVFHIGGMVVVFAVVTVLFNAYWMIPQAYAGFSKYSGQLFSMGGFQGILAWENVVSRSSSYINLLRLQGMPDWYDSPFHPYAHYYLTSSLLVIASFVPMFIILLGLVINRIRPKVQGNDTLVNVFLFILLVGMFFTAGSHAPFGFLYEAFIRFVPGFAIFRSSFYKFGPAVWFSMIFLFGYYLNLLLLRVNNKLLRFSGGVAAIVFILLYHFPYFTSNFFQWNKPFTTKVIVPAYVQNMIQYVNTETSLSSRILLLPRLDPDFQADSYRWGYWSLDLLPALGMRRSVIANEKTSQSIVPDIYQAIENDNEAVFLRLAAIAHISKVLWRGDILYNDKTTTAEYMSGAKNNLEHFHSIREEQRFGEWVLYSIQNSFAEPAIHPVDQVIMVPKDASLGRLFPHISIHDADYPAFIDAPFTDSSVPALFFPYVTDQFTQALCAFCNPFEVKTLDQSVLGSYSRFLPNSPFYFLSENKERRTLASFRGLPAQLADAHLVFASKRILELTSLLLQNRSFDEIQYRDVTKAVSSYRYNMTEALQEVNKLGPLEKNVYLNKVMTYAKIHSRYLVWWNFDSIPPNFFDDLLTSMQKTINDIDPQIWKSEGNSMRYFITVPESGTYDIIITDKESPITDMFLDGAAMVRSSDVAITQGIHTFELVFADNENMLVNGSATNSSELVIHYGKPQRFPIANLDNRNAYTISFDYQVTQGRSPVVTLTQKNDKKTDIGSSIRKLREVLIDDGKWYSVSYTVVPNFGATEAQVEFTLDSDNPWSPRMTNQQWMNHFESGEQGDKTVLSIKNFQVKKIRSPYVYLRQRALALALSKPTISSVRFDPTLYIVNVEGVTSSFLLQFDEAYNSGWKALLIPHNIPFQPRTAKALYVLMTKGKKVDPSHHIKINGFANGWWIDEQGNYYIVLVYLPQIIFYLGIGVSCGGLGVGLLYLLKTWRRR